jgi:hypothetical protein
MMNSPLYFLDAIREFAGLVMLLPQVSPGAPGAAPVQVNRILFVRDNV